MKVLFVGDKPSRLNNDPEVAFVGTPSFKKLLEWVNYLDLKEFAMVNSEPKDYLKIRKHYKEGYILVALGVKAGVVLTTLGYPNFILPHPSPKNRKLNNPAYVETKLTQCKKFLEFNNY